MRTDTPLALLGAASFPLSAMLAQDAGAVPIHRVFDTSGFPPRWECGDWSQALGWLHIVSDVAIWGAYTSIPALLFYLWYRKRLPGHPVTWLFVAFILTCGIGHLIEAIIFWEPVYRLAGVWKGVIAVVSWATVVAMVPVVPKMLALSTVAEANVLLREEVANRTRIEESLRSTNAELLEAKATLERSYQELSERDAELNRVNRELEFQKQALDQHAIVAITDSAGVITYVNDKFTEISGYSPEELVGQTHRVVNSDTHPRSFFTGLWRQIAAGKTWRGEICNRAKDGRLYWVDTTIVPFRDEEGSITRYVAIRSDITQLKRTEATLREKSEALEHSNGDLEQFVYAASHDLKSPLVTILGFAAHLREDLDRGATDDMQDCIDRIESAASRLRENVDQLLALSRVGRVDTEATSIELAGLVDEVTSLLSEEIDDAGAEVTLDLRAPAVEANRVALHQVILNLVANALRYGAGDAGAKIEITSETREDRVRIAVRDHGPGIHPDYHRKVFRLFERLGGEKEGTGVGLAIVKRIAESHGGSAGVDSTPGRGATFWIELPIEPHIARSPAP